jgi:hypothetical protein
MAAALVARVRWTALGPCGRHRIAPVAQRAAEPRQNNRHRCLGVRRQPALFASCIVNFPTSNSPTSPTTIWIPQMTKRKLVADPSLDR